MLSAEDLRLWRSELCVSPADMVVGDEGEPGESRDAQASGLYLLAGLSGHVCAFDAPMPPKSRRGRYCACPKLTTFLSPVVAIHDLVLSQLVATACFGSRLETFSHFPIRQH